MDDLALDRHLVVLTRGSAYHLIGQTCIGVMDRGRGEWKVEHQAVDSTLRGSRREDDTGVHIISPGGVRVGERLVFGPRSENHVSGEVLAIEELPPARSRRVRVTVPGHPERVAAAAPAPGPLQRLLVALGALNPPANSNQSGT